MEEYVISRVKVPDWTRVPAVVLHHTQWLAPCPVSAQAQACHNGETLFVRMEALEPEIRATLQGPLDPVSEDSCLEFFFAPLADDRRYFNFECNPLGALYLGIGTGRTSLVRQIVQDQGMFQITPFFTPGGWGVTLAIPRTFLQLYVPGYVFSGEAAGNFYKCGDKTVHPHYLSWSPMSCSTPDFHRREDFGRLIFL